MASYQVERSITINADQAPIYDKIANFRQWESWSPWDEMDPDMRKTYGGPEAGVGASYAWVGNRKVGQGNMAITDAAAPNRVDIDLEFLKPFKAQNKTVFRLDSAGQGTEVTWTMTGQHTFLSRIMGIFMPMDKLVGKDFEKGLARLKADVEG